MNLQYAKAPRRYSKTTIKPMVSTLGGHKMKLEKSNTQAAELVPSNKDGSSVNTLPSETQITHMDTLPDPVICYFNEEYEYKFLVDDVVKRSYSNNGF